MRDPQPETAPPEAVRHAAAEMIELHGTAALGLAALSASRSMRASAPEAAAFWLCVCDLIRARHREVTACLRRSEAPASRRQARAVRVRRDFH